MSLKSLFFKDNPVFQGQNGICQKLAKYTANGDKLDTVFAPFAVKFYRKVRKGDAEFARRERPISTRSVYRLILAYVGEFSWLVTVTSAYGRVDEGQRDLRFWHNSVSRFLFILQTERNRTF